MVFRCTSSRGCRLLHHANYINYSTARSISTLSMKKSIQYQYTVLQNQNDILLNMQRFKLKTGISQSIRLFATSNAKDIENEYIEDEEVLYESSEEDQVIDNTVDEYTNEIIDKIGKIPKFERNWPEIMDIYENVKNDKTHKLNPSLSTAIILAFADRHRPIEAADVLNYARSLTLRPGIHAYSSVIASCYAHQQYKKGIQTFEAMRTDGFVPKLVTYSRVLSTALKQGRHELVLEVFDDLIQSKMEPGIIIYNIVLSSCSQARDLHTAVNIYKTLKRKQINLTPATYHSLAICAGKTGYSEFALNLYHEYIEAGYKPTIVLYNSVISACSKQKRWNDIVTLYEVMPKELQATLHSIYLSAVLMAFAKSPTQEHKEYAIQLFKAQKNVNLFGHNAVLQAYVDLNRTKEFFDLFNVMRRKDHLTKKLVLYGHIRCGRMDRAITLLSGLPQHISIESWRDVVYYCANYLNDYFKATYIIMEMIRQTPFVLDNDWKHALEFALQLENKSKYWQIRDWMDDRALHLVHELPEELILPRGNLLFQTKEIMKKNKE